MSNNIEVFEYNNPNARFGFTPNSILNLKEMSNKKQSSIDWFVEQLIPVEQYDRVMDMIEQAKAMHKEEMIDAVNFGDERGKITTYSTAEQYYNETYNNENTDTTT